ncbi:MepB family protein [Microbacterium resistens]|uniref:MepB family protein n=1 Tax=Microbacterium resistens TaxID=156977 RepID=UPI00286C053F|nr:MepB family protein [Microbacterium resistens]
MRLGGLDATVEGPWLEEQSGAYESGLVRIGSESWRLRTARVTPKKPGAFVAVWTRDPLGGTRPFATDDQTAGLLVFVQDDQRFGVFRFTTSHLDALGVTRSASSPGKRGFRVYPSWSVGLNPQAERTRRAQSVAFVSLT